MVFMRLGIPVPFRAAVSTRYIHYTARKMAQEGSENDLGVLLSKHGRKLKPRSDKFVVLTPRQTGVIRLPKKARGPKSSHVSLSILEGFDFSKHRNKVSNFPQSQDLDILSNIQETTTKLMQFKEEEDNQQVAKSIDSCQPSTTAISEKRYHQLEKVLDEQFTLKQLKTYCTLKHGLTKSTVTKKHLIPTIIDHYWGCKIDYNKSEHEDLIVENEISLETRDIYLLLLTQNGKILQNLARIGATIAVLIDENKIIVRSSSHIFRYVEASIARILENVYSDELPINDIIKNHSIVGRTNTMSPEEAISLIQTQSSSYVEVNEDQKYTISTIGKKNMRNLNSLLMWVLNYNPQYSYKLISYDENDKAQKYPFTDYQWISWIDRKSSWYRLQNPVPLKQSEAFTIPDILGKIDSITKLLQNQTDKCAKPVCFGENETLSIQLGQVLKNDNDNIIFQSKIPEMIPKVLQMPLWHKDQEAEDLIAADDEHIYLLQMKFLPNLAGVNHKVNLPPLELWFTLDEFNNADLSTIRGLHIYSDSSALLQLPFSSHDMKISSTKSLDVIPEEVPTEKLFTWIEEHQPALRSFLQESFLNFGSNRKPRFPSELELKLELDGFEEPQTITYSHMCYYKHRVLRFRYKDEYLVQYSEIDGGNLGGTTSSIEVMNSSASVDKETLSKFISDASEL